MKRLCVVSCACAALMLFSGPASSQSSRHEPGNPDSVDRGRPASLQQEPEVAFATATVVRQPYLQMVTDSSITIRWRTQGATDSRVEYGTTEGVLSSSVTDAAVVTDHVVEINGLSAGTTYYYNVGQTGRVHVAGSLSHYFKTAPAVGSQEPFTIWAVGDGGNGTSTQINVMNAMLTENGGASPDLAVYLGDIAYGSGTDSEFTNNYFGQYGPVIRNTVVWPTLGNHEGASTTSGECSPIPCTAGSTGPYYDAFTLPAGAEAGGVASGTEAYYSFEYANVHFISLNSYEVSRSGTGPMALWLDADLLAVPASQDWVVAFWHHPPYTKGTHNSDTETELREMRENILPILEAGGVDLVLCGHSHIYERSYLIDGAYTTPTPSFATLDSGGNIIDGGDGRLAGDGAYIKTAGQNAHEGAVYVTAGHGGQGTGGSANHPVMYFSETANGSCLIDVQDGLLQLRNVRVDGTVTDTFAIQKAASCAIDDDCMALDGPCTDGVCTAMLCESVPKADLTACDDGIACTSSTGACDAGVCIPDSDLCTAPEMCNPISQACEIPPADPLPIVEGDVWKYIAGSAEPSTPLAALGWAQIAFDDSSWDQGPSGFGFGDGDDATDLTSVMSGLTTFYTRRLFDIADPAQVLALTLSVDYDDGYVCYINGSEVARSASASASGTPPAFGATATSHEASGGDGSPQPVEITSPSPSVLVAGNNVLACHGLNTSDTSSDLSLIVELSAVTADPLPISEGDTWTYFKGLAEPTPGGATTDWTPVGFDDSTWLSGPSGFGYADCVAANPGTILSDMQGTTAPPAYVSVYIRKLFYVADAARIETLTLRMNYDDGFVAYLNGVEVDRSQVTGTPPSFDTDGTSHECGTVEDFVLDPLDLVTGVNILAIQGHNAGPNSSDFALIPELVATEFECLVEEDCDSLDTACTNGTCNLGTKTCETSAINEGGACDDASDCTVTDVCTAGVCAGTLIDCGSQVCNPVDGECVDCVVDGDCGLGQVCGAGNVCESAPIMATFQQGVSGYTGTVDTFLNAGAATANNATTTPLVVDLAANVNQILLRFDNVFAGNGGPIPDGSTIQSASLTINVVNDSAAGALLHRMLQTWNDTDNWNTWTGGIQADDVEALSTADVVESGSAVTLHIIDVTSSVAAWSAGAANHGWVWLPPGTDDSWQFDSSEGGTPPLLSVTYLAPSCASDAECDDGNECTDDTCNIGTGVCANVANDGNSCTDGIACTADACTSGTCVSTDNCTGGDVCNLSNGICETPVALQAGDVIISGFQASGSDEWIELFNTTSAPVDLDTCELIVRIDTDGNGTSDLDWEFPSGQLNGEAIPANGFYLLREGAGGDFTGALDLATGEGATRAASIELVIDAVHMDYVLYGREDLEPGATADVPPGDLPFDGSTFPRAEVIRNCGAPGAGGTCSASGSFNEGATLRLSADDLYAGHAVDGRYTDEATLGDGYAAGVWTSAHQTTGGSAPRNSSSPTVAPPTCNDNGDCDDGNPCTDDTCPVMGGMCLFTNDDSNACDDGEPCTDDACVAGVCVPTPDDGNSCSDGVLCTTDACVSGSCVGTDNCTAREVCNLTTGSCELPSLMASFQQGVSGYVGTVDTYLESADAAANNATASPLVVDLGPEQHILMRFENVFISEGGPVPNGATIVSASLTINVINESAGVGASLHRMLQAWNDADNWNTWTGGIQADDTEALSTADVSSSSGTGLHVIDVTTSIAAWAAGAANLGWAWLPPGTDNSWQFDSSEGGTPPLLEIEYLPCDVNADCDDSNDCTADTCNAGNCEYANINEGGGCDDGVSCTSSETCTSGVCDGGVDNCPVGQFCNGTSCELLPNVPPDAPTNEAPANGAMNIAANPNLCVDVLDQNGDALDVTFYGREFTTGPTPPFTLIALPDTQFYSENFPEVFKCQTEWVLDEGTSVSGSCPSTPADTDFGFPHGLDIVFTTQLGDCTQNGNVLAEWQNAEAALGLFDPAGDEEKMPFGVAVGNHDQGTGNGDPGNLSAPDSTTTLYNQFFGVSRFLGRSYYAGSYNHCDDGSTCNVDADCTGIGAGTCHIYNDNHYELFSGGGMDFIIIHMEWDSAASSPLRDAALVWADNLLTTHANRRAIIVSHFVVQPSGNFSTQGQAIYTALNHHPNWFLMLGGHLNEAARRTDPVGPVGENTLTSIMSDYQGGANGGNGWLRVMTFVPEDDEIVVTTYSPFLDQQKPDTPAPANFDAHNFVIPYAMEGGLPFQNLGTVSSVASGGTACVNWPARQAGTDYEWYVEISDGQDTTSSAGSTYTFTSDGACANDADCDDGVFCNGAETCDNPGTELCLAGADPCPGQLCDESGDVCVDCVTPGDCDDSDLCTDDVCTAGTCTNPAIDCSDGNACTDDVCTAGVCSNPYNPVGGCCDDAGDCADGDACTTDTCVSNDCDNAVDPLCCTVDGDCDDSDPCTADTCNTANAGALSFDGSDDHVTMGAASGLNTATFTLEAWVNWDGGGSTANTGGSGIVAIPVVTKGRGEADADVRDANYFLGILPGGVVAADFEEHTTGLSPGLNHPAQGTTVLSTGTWHHIAATYDGTCWEIYVDGVADLAAANCPAQPPNFVSTQHFALGTAMTSTAAAEGRFSGLMDEVRVWNRALSGAEIAANLNLAILTDPDLLGRWGLDEGTGTTAGDSTTPMEDGTIVSATWELANLPNVGTGSCQLDPIAGCCNVDGDCTDDGNACTDEQCNANVCESVYSPFGGCCTGDPDCDDGDGCTTDTCDAGNCVNSPDALCCDEDADCDDSSTCTLDVCSLGTTAGLDLDGTDDHVAMGTAPTLGTAEFTLEGWFRWDNGGATASSGNGGVVGYPLICKGVGEADGNNRDANYFFAIESSSGALTADFEEGAGGSSPGLNHPVTGNTAVTPGVWHHLAVTYDGTCWELYLDGVADTTGTNCPGEPPRADSIQHFGIGATLTSTGSPEGAFDGKVDEVRVWSRALSQAEIAAGMNATITTAPDLLGRWGLDEGTGTTAADSAGSTPGTLANGALWETGDLPGLTADSCVYIAEAGCCTVDGDCDDADVCTTDTCNAGTCEFAPIGGCCSLDSECVDSDPCTVDTCDTNTCSNVLDPLCCADDGDCDDSDICTTDSCAVANSAAIAFDGVDDYVDLGNDPTITDYGTGSFTVEGWFYLNSAPATWEGIFRHGRQGPNSQVAVQFASGLLTVSVEDTSGNQADTPGQTFSLNTWHHFAAVIDRSADQARMYLDAGTPTTVTGGWGANPISSTDNVVLGEARGTTGTLIAPLDGMIDEIRIWDHARTPAEILANKDIQIVSAPGLLARYGLNEAAGTTTTDSVGALAGTLEAGASWETSNLPDLGDGSCQFDPIPGCCEVDGDCPDDGNACTDETCNANVCETAYNPTAGCCSADSDCDDGDACSDDTCNANNCSNTVDPLCCDVDADCDDSNVCTTDTCSTNDAALSFDGSNDHVTMGPATGLNAAQFTLETWFKWNAGGSTASTGGGGVDAYPLVTKGRGESEAATLNCAYFLGILATGELAADFEEHGTGTTEGLNHPVTGTTQLTAGDGVWHHAAVTYDGSCWQLYLDGVADTPGTTCPGEPPDFDSIQHFGLGTAFNSSGAASGRLSGLLDEVRVWDHARSGAEILADMNSQIISASGLLGRWGLDEGSGSAVADSTAPAEDGTIVGAAWELADLAPIDSACLFELIPGCCNVAGDCPSDGNACTDETCLANACASTYNPTAGCCVSDNDCDDGDGLTLDTCDSGDCNNTPVVPCSSDGECDDSELCTDDVCATSSNSALLFDGAGDHVAFGASAAHPELSLSVFTIEAWFRRDGAGNPTNIGDGASDSEAIVAKGRGSGEGGNNDFNYFLGVRQGTTTLVGDFETDDNGAGHRVDGTTPLVTGQWYHGALTYDGSVLTLYLDGQVEDTFVTSDAPEAQSVLPFSIGAAFDTSTDDGNWNGAIDEVRVWSVARTQGEIQADMDAQILSATNLVGRWGFEEGAGTSAGDSTASANDGTLAGDTAWITSGLPIMDGFCANTPIGDGGACDDGSECTTGETCTGGVCGGGTFGCDDGNPCNGVETCNVDMCDPGTPISCPAGDVCDPANGVCVTPVCETFQQGDGNSYSGTVDTYVFGTQDQGTNFSADVEVRQDLDNTRHGLLYFGNVFVSESGPVPDGATIDLATLTYVVTDANASGPNGCALHRMIQPWVPDAATLTWNSLVGGVQPDGVEAEVTPDVTGTPLAPTVPGAHAVDVTTSVAAWSSGVPNEGWVFLPLDNNGYFFSSSEGLTQADRPHLEVCYLPPPECVVDLDCDDSDPCTADACVLNVCEHSDDDGVACDDGVFCTTGETCLAGSCGGGVTTDCSDGDPCTADICNLGTDMCENPDDYTVDVFVQLEGLSNAVTRDVTFVMSDCAPVTLSVDFDSSGMSTGTDGMGLGIQLSADPLSTEISAVEGHTLLRVLPLSFGTCPAIADFTGADSLRAGDFQTATAFQDNLVDIVDFTILSVAWLAPVDPNSSLGADINGDGNQASADFTAVLINFFESGDVDITCPEPLNGDGKGPRLSVRVDSLDLKDADYADMNDDGVIDVRDIRALTEEFNMKLGPVAEQKLRDMEDLYHRAKSDTKRSSRR